MNENKLSQIKQFALSKSQKNDIHGFEHVMRVYKTVLELGNNLGADLNILKVSALLHDIGRTTEKKDGQNHAEISAKLARQYLSDNSLNLGNDFINEVFHAISAHSFSNNILAETLEAQILSDADKLDALGAIGLYRTIGFTIENDGDLNDVIAHLTNKILKLGETLYLDHSKSIAEGRMKIVRNFYEEIRKEI
ncbi:MAG: HD domain-containing protein [Candidatus Lokiarchaeota archaeon]|jgi:uncharacterized protein|nr:HD domain-containing protein [Candidatus Lokiarchaeota archaeon]MBD3200699.1 HD domain-containing protein [Candidatus Lokiarchaeota archaeon]